MTLLVIEDHMMPKLTDTQAILLSTAAQRSDGNLMPPPDSVGALTDRIRKTVLALIKRGFAVEQPVTTDAATWRTEGEGRFGAVITDAGRQAIGVEPDAPMDAATNAVDACSADQHTAAGEPPRTKAALVLTLLGRDQGATLAELVAATGWLPHTTRAALTGLRKKGHTIGKAKRDEVTCYSLARTA